MKWNHFMEISLETYENLEISEFPSRFPKQFCEANMDFRMVSGVSSVLNKWVIIRSNRVILNPIKSHSIPFFLSETPMVRSWGHTPTRCAASSTRPAAPQNQSRRSSAESQEVFREKATTRWGPPSYKWVYKPTHYNCLMVWDMFSLSIQLGMSSSQLTNSCFSEG